MRIVGVAVEDVQALAKAAGVDQAERCQICPAALTCRSFCRALEAWAAEHEDPGREGTVMALRVVPIDSA